MQLCVFVCDAKQLRFFANSSVVLIIMVCRCLHLSAVTWVFLVCDVLDLPFLLRLSLARSLCSLCVCVWPPLSLLFLWYVFTILTHDTISVSTIHIHTKSKSKSNSYLIHLCFCCKFGHLLLDFTTKPNYFWWKQQFMLLCFYACFKWLSIANARKFEKPAINFGVLKFM